MCNVYEPKADNTKVAPELVCEIKGLLVDDEIYARKFAEDITDRICKELSVVFIRHNANRLLFQPRVEAAWSMARFASTDYLPFVEAKRKLLSKDSDGERTFFVEDHMRVRDSIYVTSFSLITASEMNLEECLSTRSEAVMYLMNVYYSALGTELVKSKFFHLFSMIEFCEREYCAHNGAKGILDKKSIDAIMDILNEQDIIKNIGAEKDKAGDNKAKRENVLSKIRNF